MMTIEATLDIGPHHMVGAVILGMHRSGTSAAARALALSGFEPGRASELEPSDDHNPTGYYERRRIMRANDEFLALAGGSWDRPPPREEVLAVRGACQREINSLMHDILQEADDAPVLVKDPRISVLLPLWWPSLRERFTPLLVVRNPIEIALSLMHRDGFPLAKAFALWEVYLTSLLDGLHEQIVQVVAYERLSSDPGYVEALVVDIVERVEPKRRSAVVPARARDALDVRLHRNRSQRDEVREHLTSHQKMLWEFLDDLECGSQLMKAPEEFRRASSYAWSTLHHDFSGSGRDQAQGLVQLEATVQHLSRMTEALAAEKDQRGHRIAELERQLIETVGLTAELERRQETVTALAQSRTNELETLIEESAAVTSTLTNELAAVYRSRTWRVGRVISAPSRWSRRLFASRQRG
jgi:hypothetical protein